MNKLGHLISVLFSELGLSPLTYLVQWVHACARAFVLAEFLAELFASSNSPRLANGQSIEATN